MRTRLVLLASWGLSACSSSSFSDATSVKVSEQSRAGGSAAPDISPPPVTAEKIEVAYFAGGCFWGVEHYLEQLDGVFAVESGYMGGTLESPSYAEVTSQRSGHLESVRVRFDPSRVDYETVAKRFFEIHDPTQKDGQGPDIGSQYLSAVFYTDSEQKRVSEGLIKRLEERGYDVATDLRPATKFWKAEAYHQDYYAKTGKRPYCHTRVRRFGD